MQRHFEMNTDVAQLVCRIPMPWKCRNANFWTTVVVDRKANGKVLFMCVKMLAILLLAPHMIRFFSIYKVSFMKWSPLMYNITALVVLFTANLMVLQGDEILPQPPISSPLLP